jgi:hypothetical protein
MTMAELIRAYVDRLWIQPARVAGLQQVAVQCGAVHRAMGLRDRLPAVAGAIGSNLFEHQYRVRCIERTGPHQGSTLTFTFEVLP